jgi:hypothetical protein
MTTKRRLAVRRRLADYAEFVRQHGFISLADAERIGEISMFQAWTDLAILMEDYSDLGLFYDNRARKFRVRTK